MLIAPLYGFVYNRTGDSTYRTRGDLIFQGGISVYDGDGFYVSGSFLGTRSAVNPAGKQFDQQLYWGPEYITLAEATPGNATVDSGLEDKLRGLGVPAPLAKLLGVGGYSATDLVRANLPPSLANVLAAGGYTRSQLMQYGVPDEVAKILAAT